MQSSQNVDAFDAAVGESGSTFTFASTLQIGKSKMIIKRLALEPVEEWLIKYEMQSANWDVAENRFKLGEIFEELVPGRQRVISRYTHPHDNQLLAFRKQKNGTMVIVSRLVDPAQPNVMTSTFTANGVSATIILIREEIYLTTLGEGRTSYSAGSSGGSNRVNVY